MPEAKVAITVPSEDPKKKKQEKESEQDATDANKKKGEDKEGEDLVCAFTVFLELSTKVSVDSRRKIFSSRMSWRCFWSA